MLTTKAGPFHLEFAEPIRCVIVDDHEMLRYGVRRLLEDAPDFTVVGEAGDAAEALKLVLEHRPDLVLLDISMPGMSSFEAGRLIEEHTGTRIVYLTMHEDREYVQQALRSGASGYLLKDTPAPLLLRALREIHRGERSLSPRIQTKLRDDAIQPNQAGNFQSNTPTAISTIPAITTNFPISCTIQVIAKTVIWQRRESMQQIG